jgi:hypothetical protein
LVFVEPALTLTQNAIDCKDFFKKRSAENAIVNYYFS